MAIKYGNRISWRAHCFLNCFSKGRWDVLRTLIRLRSLSLLISQNQLILIEAWAESELMFKASDRRRNEITFLLYRPPIQRPDLHVPLYISKVIDKSALRMNRDASAMPSVAKSKEKVIGSCVEARTCTIPHNAHIKCFANLKRKKKIQIDRTGPSP